MRGEAGVKAAQQSLFVPPTTHLLVEKKCLECINVIRQEIGVQDPR